MLGLLLGPLAESNLRRALVIGGPSILVTKPISAGLLALALLSLVLPLVGRARAARRARAQMTASADEPALTR